MTTVASQSDVLSVQQLTINIPANVYHLSHFKTEQGISRLQQLIDLASTVADGLEQIQAAIRDLGCDCIIDQINDPTQAYMEQLKNRYPDQPVVTTALNAQGPGVAVFIGAKVRLTRTIRMHVQIIEAILLAEGENVKVVEIFSEDAKLLSDLGASVSAMIDGFVATDGKTRCDKCGMGKSTRMSSLRLPSRAQPSRIGRLDRSSSLAQSTAGGSFSDRASRYRN